MKKSWGWLRIEYPLFHKKGVFIHKVFHLKQGRFQHEEKPKSILQRFNFPVFPDSTTNTTN
ncbi:hypothetical protein A2783_01665 [Microgenomates group bacterium RIFCSPHIGHO2_01_FULL_45_11]|nr:MAG: hypothetical protein A2783_01665 [Microgenomates group bacterium RIFCSPHIGHO2_01_FULL_45_11]